MQPGAPVGPSVARPGSWACCVLCLSPGQGHLLVTPGSIPLNPAPGIPDPNQCFRLASPPRGHGFQVTVAGDLQNREEGEEFRTWSEGLRRLTRGENATGSFL